MVKPKKMSRRAYKNYLKEKCRKLGKQNKKENHSFIELLNVQDTPIASSAAVEGAAGPGADAAGEDVISDSSMTAVEPSLLDLIDNTPSAMIDAEKVIRAVKVRPALYSKLERCAPKHRKTKARQWREVCRELNPNFDNLSGTNKLEYEREVYKRWRSLRTCFSRELALQRREQLTPTHRRRKKYEYFDALDFLLPEYDDDLQEDSNQIQRYESEEESAELDDLEESSRSDGGAVPQIKTEIETEHPLDTKVVFDTDIQVEPIDALESVARTEESDCDKLFFLSLIPSFRRINPRRKLAAKIEIMKVLQTFQED